MAPMNPAVGISMRRQVARALALPLLVSFLYGCATTPDSVRRFEQDLQAAGPDDGVVIPRVRDFEKGRRRDGASALYILFDFWGIRLPRSAVQPLMLDAGAELATIQEQMMKFADHQGLWSFASYGQIRDVEERLRAGQPVIVILQEGSPAAFDRRYSVVIGFNRIREELLCQEGAGSPVVHTYRQFGRMWHPVRRWMLVVSPPDVTQWPLSYLELASQARFYEARGQRDLALERFERALALEPDFIDLILATGTAHRNVGQLDQAERLYRRAVGMNNMHARACNNLAYHLADQGKDLDEAELLARRAILLEPSNPAALDTLGLVFWKKGDLKSAAEALERARHRSRHLSDQAIQEIALRLARVYLAQGDAHLTRQVIQDLRRQIPDAEIPPDLDVYTR